MDDQLTHEKRFDIDVEPPTGVFRESSWVDVLVSCKKLNALIAFSLLLESAESKQQNVDTISGELQREAH
ncbi:hypothetical protein OGATHE_004861 [Ogataea polymorpha]|uniref:Uncharacterized protein n=1 Tax=Ogataea polymorpha TaxID=460523 RepID=A0A9P8P0Y7_9ASCO|nr:hypothetical protein OGATHE_004861 [Ogataea polymorpha]